MATNQLHDASIPSALRSGLRRLLRRYRLMVVLKGLSAALAVFLLGMFVAMGLDRVFFLPDFMRTALSVLVWLASACALWLFIVRPLARIPHQAALAASVEAAHPELAEEFSTSVELVGAPGRPEYRGSEELIGAVIRNADDDSRKVDFARVVRTERVRRFAFVALLLVLAAGVFWAVWRADFSLMFARFVTPWANLPRISSTELLISPGDVLVARSDSQLITAVVQKGHASTCWLYVRAGNSPWTRIRMANQESGSFSHLLSAVDTDLEYHLIAGDAITRDYNLTVVDRPAVTTIDIAYQFPPYTNLPASTLSGKDGDLKAVLGTVAVLTFHTNRPLAQGSIEINKSVPSAVATVQPHQTLTLEPAGSLEYKTSATLDADGSYSLSLRDENGFANASDIPYRITAIDDAAPLVEITEPEKTLVLPRVQPVNLGLRIEDDFGLAKVEVVYEVNNRPVRRHNLPLTGLGAPKITEVYTWALADLGFRPGDVIRYHVEATDTRPGKPNVGISQTQYIRISFDDLSKEQQALEQSLQRMQDQLNKVVDKLKQAKGAEEAQIQDQAANFNAEQERKRSALTNLEAARQDTANLSRMLSADPFLNSLQPTADEIAQTHIPNAQAEEKKIDPNRRPPENLTPAENALAETNNAIAKAESMQRELEALAKLEREQMQLAELSAREANLAQDTSKNDQLTSDQAKDLADRQQQIEDTLNKAITDADRAAALAQKAEELKRLADAANGLAKREDNLKAETDDANAKRPDAQNPTLDEKAEDQQKETKQNDIKGDTRTLAEMVAQTAVELAGVDPDMGKAADDAARNLKNEAAGKMEQAAANLDKNQLPSASGREKEASDALKKAAGNLDALKQKVQEQLAKLSQDQQQGDADLAAAKGQMQAAQDQLQGNGKGKEAGQKMDAAAKLLAQAAQSMLSRGKPLKPTGDKRPANLDTRQLLMQLGLTPEEWNRLPGELRQELLESYNEKYPSEYRKLVREYFREISGIGISKE